MNASFSSAPNARVSKIPSARRIRIELREDMETHLRAHGIAAKELASIVRVLRSRIDVSLSGVTRP